MVKTTQEYINGAAARFAADNANDDTAAVIVSAVETAGGARTVDGRVGRCLRVAAGFEAAGLRDRAGVWKRTAMTLLGEGRREEQLAAFSVRDARRAYQQNRDVTRRMAYVRACKAHRNIGKQVRAAEDAFRAAQGE